MIDDYIRPDGTHSALFIIDVQRDTTLAGAAIEIPGTLRTVPYIKQLVQVYRDIGLPIVHVIRLYNKDGSNADLCRRKAVFCIQFSVFNTHQLASYVYIQYIHIYQKCLVNIVKKVIIDYFACCGKYCPVRYLSSSSISSKL